MSEDALAPPRHEPSDVGVRFVLVAMALVGAVLLAMVGIGAWMFPSTIGARFVPEHLPQTASPALQPSPRADMAEFLADEHRQLDSVGWIDRGDGRVHIPIDDAMRKIAAEGIPGWPGHTP